jgi:hypothetical protein
VVSVQDGGSLAAGAEKPITATILGKIATVARRAPARDARHK